MRQRNTKIRRAVFIVVSLTLLSLIQSSVPILILQNLVSDDQAHRLVDTLRTATPGIIVALIVTYLYERTKDEYYSDRGQQLADEVSRGMSAALEEDNERRYRKYLRDAPPIDLLQAGMQRLYGERTRLDTLVDNLVPERGLNRDVDVHFILRDDPGDPDVWSLEMTYRAMVYDLSEYLVAMVEGNDTASQLYVTCPRLNDVFHFENREGADRAAEAACTNPSSLRFMIEREEDKFGPLTTAPLRRVPIEQYDRYGVPTTGSDGKVIVLLAAEIPQGANRNVVYITRSSGISDAASKFCYFSDDRPAFVRTVVFDWTGMTAANAGAQHHVIPFYIAKGEPPTVAPDATRAEVVVEQWLWPGQGILLLW